MADPGSAVRPSGADDARVSSGTLADMQIRYELWDTAWDRFTAQARDLVARDEVRRVCEVGAGANPALPPELLREHHVDYVLLDASQEELDKASDDYVKVCGDFTDSRPPVEGPFDLVLSRFVAEHIADPRGFHANVRSLLAVGGVAVHFFSTLYALPFLVNRALPERLMSALLLRLQPGRVSSGHHAKFPAYYRWCRGPTSRQVRRFEEIGFETQEYVGYFGHGYYDGVRILDSLVQRSADATVRHPVPALTSYAMVILRASAGAGR